MSSVPPVPATPSSIRKGRARRRTVLLILLLAATLTTSACLPPLLEPPTSGLTYGKGPLDAVREAADTTTSTGPYASCGLSSTDLAAMMMVPTYFEAGLANPSPMTLSRWDNVATRASNARLFPFSQTSGPYVNAFFSPGIGMWQFDSAGGWDLTAADAIDSVTSANTAASVIAYRWCNAPDSRRVSEPARRMYAWGPWFGCTSGSSTRCEDRFQQLVTNGSLNTAQDAAVDRYGGMQQRTCNVAGVGNNITCWYVDPSKAQGAKGWTFGTYDPARPDLVTPLPKPFYVVRGNGREYRIWLPADTGFDIGVTASKPVRSDARTSLEWSRTAELCDTVLLRGDCARSMPIGVLDGAAPRPGGINLWGWVNIPGAPSGVVSVTVDGRPAGTLQRTIARPDVQRVFPGSDATTGFNGSVPADAGVRTVCITTGSLPTGAFGCRTVTVAGGSPFGVLDSVTAVPGGIRYGGWAIDPDTADPIWIHMYVDDSSSGVVADGQRPDVGAVFPGYGAAHGFGGTLSAAPGRRTVCAWAINVGVGSHQRIGCRQVTVAGGSPIGFLDAMTRSGDEVTAQGWAIDPDTAEPVQLHVYVGSRLSGALANTARPDVGRAFPGYGDAHGFSVRVPAPAGSSVCVYAINVGAGSHRLLGCRTP